MHIGNLILNGVCHLQIKKKNRSNVKSKESRLATWNRKRNNNYKTHTPTHPHTDTHCKLKLNNIEVKI